MHSISPVSTARTAGLPTRRPIRFTLFTPPLFAAGAELPVRTARAGADRGRSRALLRFRSERRRAALPPDRVVFVREVADLRPFLARALSTGVLSSAAKPLSASITLSRTSA